MIPDYLLSFDTGLLPTEDVDVLIVGSGIAGLRAALELKGRSVAIVAKDTLDESCTWHAQGGVAAAIGPDDSTESHIRDTMAVGGGINNQEAVRILVEEGVERVKELISWGFTFDGSGGSPDLGREGGHSCNRVLHADGDATGKRISEFLFKKAADNGLSVRTGWFLVDLLSTGHAVRGALLLDTRAGRLVVVRTPMVILASGGAGQLFQETTNPGSITGDAQAAAFRRGAELSDLEFYQFHPTTFYLAGAPRFLISEAVRGEGAVLKNSLGERFMKDYHPLADLAPRDIVSQAILDQMKKTSTNCVHLDLSHLSPAVLRKRFPTISRMCKAYGISIGTNPIPVRPAAHYFMGGISTDLFGRTTLEGLFACGETACTGAHGANRLASNSLLEGLVFGARAGGFIREHLSGTRAPAPPSIAYKFPQKFDIPIDREDLKRSIRSLMWRNVGIQRSADTLSYAIRKLEEWEKYAFWKAFQERSGFESQNMLILATMMARAALMRTESRGVHARTDFPRTDDRHFQRPIVCTRKNIFWKKRP